jgi:hypothetical protein
MAYLDPKKSKSRRKKILVDPSKAISSVAKGYGKILVDPSKAISSVAKGYGQILVDPSKAISSVAKRISNMRGAPAQSVRKRQIGVKEGSAGGRSSSRRRVNVNKKRK